MESKGQTHGNHLEQEDNECVEWWTKPYEWQTNGECQVNHVNQEESKSENPCTFALLIIENYKEFYKQEKWLKIIMLLMMTSGIPSIEKESKSEDPGTLVFWNVWKNR